MAEPRITIVINGKTYSLCADDADALDNMPGDDRQHLITLLEAVKYNHDLGPAATPQTWVKAKVPAPSTPEARVAATRITTSDATPTRMGSGDIDALMARLAVEDRRSRKPELTRTGIYKVTGGFLLLVFLLVVIL